MTENTKDLEKGSKTGVSRRSMLRAGAASVALSAFPMPYFFGRAAAATPNMTFWILNTDPTSDAGKWYQNMATEWNDSNDTKVEFLSQPGDSVAYYNKLSTTFAAGQGPDMFLLSPSDFLRYSNNGLLLDLGPYLDPTTRADFYETVMTTREVDSKVYALPMEVEPMAMYYSIEAFDAAGIKGPPKTYEELLDVAARLTTNDRYGVLFETAPGGYQVFTWYPFMWQGGGDITTEDGKTGAFNTPGTLAALKLWQDAVAKGVAPRESLGGGAWNLSANLGAGYCAMQNCGIWGVAQMRNEAPNVEYGVFALPTPPGGTPVTVAGGWAFVANAKSANRDAAGNFVNWALGADTDSSKGRILDWCTRVKADMVPRRSVAKLAVESGAFASGPMKYFADELLPVARAEPRCPPEVWQAITDAIQAAQLNGEDVQAVATATDAKINEYLATYTGGRIL